MNDLQQLREEVASTTEALRLSQQRLEAVIEDRERERAGRSHARRTAERIRAALDEIDRENDEYEKRHNPACECETVHVTREITARIRSVLDGDEKGRQIVPTPGIGECRRYPITSHRYEGARFLNPCTAKGYGTMCGASEYDHEEAP